MSAPTNPLRWFGPVPARRVELVRIIAFGYAAVWLAIRFAYVLDVASLPARRWEPVGVLDPFDAPPDRGIVVVVWSIALLGCAAAAFGKAVRLSAPVGALGMLLIATFTSSFGQVFHTEHLIVLHLAVLAAAAVLEPPLERDGTTSGWPLNLMMTILALTYVLAGIAKLRWSGLGWISGDILQNWIAIDNLRKILVDDPHSPLGGWLSSVGWVWPPIAAATLVVELGAPVALFARRWRTWWLVAAWGFHVGVFGLMAISFPYQLAGVAYVCFVRVEIGEQTVRRRWRARRASVGNRVTPSCEDVVA